MITFDSFDLQTDNIIISEVVYRNLAERVLDTAKITRRNGVKLLSDTYASKKITMSGYIVADTPAGLQDQIDSLNLNVISKSDGILTLDNNRRIEAVASSMGIGDAHYNQSCVPLELEFLCPDPFFIGNNYSVSLTVTSGTLSMPILTTISGTVFSLPQITYYPPAGTGTTTTSGITLTNNDSGETVSFYNASFLAYGSSVTFDFNSLSILEGTSESDPSGTFFKWEPGSFSGTITFNNNVGGTLSIQYDARYL